MKKPYDLLENIAELSRDHVLICYKGPFLNRVLALIGEKINLLVKEDPRLSKKVFSVFIELAQNIAYYSEERSYVDGLNEKSYGRGTFVISESNSHYRLTSANLIKRSWAPEVLEKCEIINNLGAEGLRKLKRDLRRQPKKEGQLGGNIGLVDIALKAGTPLKVEITSVNNYHSYFVLSIVISKQINTEQFID
jgi:hypothetical protein